MTATIPRLPLSNMFEYNPLTCVTGVTGIDSLSPISPGANNHSSQHSQAGLPLSGQQRLWAATGTQSYTHSPMSHGGQPPLMQQNYNRPIYSPNSTYRGSQSPGTVDILGASPYDNGSSTYQLSQLSISGSSLGHSNILSSAPNQTSLPMMNSHSQGSQPTAPSTSAGPPDAYSRPPTASGYYSGPSSSTTPHTSYPSFTSSSSQSSSITTGSLSKNASTLSPHQQHSPMHSPMQAPPYRPLPSYTLPQTMGGGSTVGGPIMSNMTNPGGQMTIMNGIGTMGHGYHPTGHIVNQHLYANSHPITQDRPFKCDICPQSFNRNHDLKRHKRIHLAIKPFPCTFCEKSFSRKDALKRHRLVKGCGIGKTPPNDGNSSSPREEIKRDPDSHSGSEYCIKQEPL
ncbi:uncharacterized protein F4817DRAFT_319632 [Daldinia loculata]|uniref:uncharacterized protein n=1 Tax=Daldinia loculata TaxID=103429 RepID=UPI0020C40DC9|nr:uncharacterized protein F4817DRAFT_319632 [Daldinia loculata]KAI1643627.1 hypothetical protein F4817DRAFT_319632 [Daldinia loculata]